MKFFFNGLLLLSLIFISCEKDEAADSALAEVAGCMDDCALNYNSEATVDGEACLYSFLGTYVISEYKLDGISLFSDYWVNPLVAGAISFDVTDGGSLGVYGFSALYIDGTETTIEGTFTNTATQLIMYPANGDPTEYWTTTKINCLEFDGNVMIDGMLAEIELTYYSSRLDYLERTPNTENFDLRQFKSKK